MHYYSCVRIFESFGAAMWELQPFKILTASGQIMSLVVLGPLVTPLPPLEILYSCVFLGLGYVRYPGKKTLHGKSCTLKSYGP